MRGNIGIRIPNGTRRTVVAFSTSSGFGDGGRGRGRGRGGSLPGSGPFNFNERAPGKLNSSEPKSDTAESHIPPGSAHGHGRAKPMPPSGLPLPSFLSSINQPPAGRGRATTVPQPQNDFQPPADRGRATVPEPLNAFQPNDLGPPGPKKPIFFRREHNVSSTVTDGFPIDVEHVNKLPGTIHEVLSGLGRGKPMKQPDPETRVTEENRHLRPPRAPGAAASDTLPERQPMPRRDDAVRNARRFLSQGEDDGSGTGRGRGFRERGGLGRGRGRGRGIGRGGFRGRDIDERLGRFMDAEDSGAAGLYVGDDADGERLAKKLGPDIMNQLTEGFEEVAGRVLPSPLEDEYLDALDINYAIEFEPEYLVEFDNPDIDEKEPIPLRDALEKMKPFLMAYEGIQSQEEWEEIMEETMARVPLLKKIVDHYSGPDRVTAKKQQEELERVAKTLPESAPSSVKQFTNRAVVSLQSNPGWGFDKKCHFMDKLVWEVSQHYK
ncbi:hypothetical protein VNO80_29941 [Phaseolus coccineus]|uniref:Hydroxyproline-rich glycoprotein family protein n=1 Tax=Phaseolus coccineus TaxID=3886 RepID=A0AAN9LCZ4_PHACN